MRQVHAHFARFGKIHRIYFSRDLDERHSDALRYLATLRHEMVEQLQAESAYASQRAMLTIPGGVSDQFRQDKQDVTIEQFEKTYNDLRYYRRDTIEHEEMLRKKYADFSYSKAPINSCFIVFEESKEASLCLNMYERLNSHQTCTQRLCEKLLVRKLSKN